jgi:hypothetical protein
MLKGIKLTAPTSLQTGIAALIFTVVAEPLPMVADPFVFGTGNPDGLMATTSRPSAPGIKETETGDVFVLTQPTSITGAAFTGLIPQGASVTSVVIEVYRGFPSDSNVGPTSGSPTFSTNQAADKRYVGWRVDSRGYHGDALANRWSRATALGDLGERP